MRGLFGLFLILLNPAVLAYEEYAKKENKGCLYCHFNQTGGPRNFLGHFYSKNGYTFKNTIYGRAINEKQPPLAPELAFQRPTAEGMLVERQTEIMKSVRFRAFTAPNFFASGQLIQSGKDFVHDLDQAGIAYNKNLEEMLLREFFGMGLYNIESLALNSGLGMSMEFSPLVHLKSRNKNMQNSKYLQSRLDFFRKVAGYDSNETFYPVYAEFVSGDPHYMKKPDFQSGKNQMWEETAMNRVVSMESLGMGLYAKSLLAQQYLDGEHVKGVGTTPRAGYTAQVLIYEMVNSLLWIRYGLGFDGTAFKAFPHDYYATRDLLYIPHELVVDFDSKTGSPKSYYVKERLSHIRDLSSLLLGLAEFYALSDPHRLSTQKIFGDGPDDSDAFPFSVNARFLARDLVMVILKNMEVMHFDTKLGAMYSTATFVKPLEHVKGNETGLTMLGLGKIFKVFFDDPEIRNVTGNLIYALGQFTIQRMQAIDGGIASVYDGKRVQADFLNRSLEDQSLVLMGLLEAFKVTREERFFYAAGKIYEFLIKNFWDENLNTFRTHEETKVLKITPTSFGATVGALREMVLATGDLRTFAYLLAYFDGILKNYSLQQSELDLTGEKVDELRDSDGDGIPQSDLAGGKFGVAPVMASEVIVEPTR